MDGHEQRRETFDGVQRKAFNVETLRAVAEMPFGIACYQCALTKDSEGRTFVVGTHAGVVATDDEANAWLRGEEVPGLKKVHREEDARRWLEEESRRLREAKAKP